MTKIHPLRMFLFVVVTAVAVFYLSGCAALGPINRALTLVKSPVVQAGVDLAVATAIGNGSDQMAKATQIKTIALAVYQASSAPAATVTLLEAALNAEVLKVAPNPADRAAFMILAATLEGTLQAYAQANPTAGVTADTLVSIQGVAQAVITACSLYGA
jgi:hypothetical protein